MSAALLAAIDAPAGVGVCVDGDNALRGNGSDGQVCMIAAGKGGGQASVALLVLGQGWQRRVLQRVRGHCEQTRPRGSVFSVVDFRQERRSVESGRNKRVEKSMSRWSRCLAGSRRPQGSECRRRRQNNTGK